MAERIKIAVEGCCHGELDAIYKSISDFEAKHQTSVDLLIICGDFQAIRAHDDFDSVAIPPKFRQLGTFHKYFTGEKTAPVPTLYIGGNHEASNYHQSLPYGGWVAPNIFYMGYASVVKFGGLRIAGLSGIFKHYSYEKGHFETPPYTRDELRSVYHCRQIEVFKLLQLTTPPDIFLSHDWPRGIEQYGDLAYLLRRKPDFKAEIDTNTLGNPAAEKLLRTHKPNFWFSAHLHIKYPAVVRHSTGEMTRFLSLDKCLPKRGFISIMEIPSEGGGHILQYDEEWLAILKSTQKFDLSTRKPIQFPTSESNERFDFRPTKEELAEIESLFEGDFTVPTDIDVTDIGAQHRQFVSKLGLETPYSIPQEILGGDDDTRE